MTLSFFSTNMRLVMACLLSVLSASANAVAAEDVPRLLYLITENGAVIASNIQFNRFDELKLRAKEVIQEKAVADAVAVVVTNQRIIGYSVFTAAWKPKRTKAGEKLESIEAEDFSALVTTSHRFLSFNGRNGVWAETVR